MNELKKDYQIVENFEKNGGPKSFVEALSLKSSQENIRKYEEFGQLSAEEILTQIVDSKVKVLELRRQIHELEQEAKKEEWKLKDIEDLLMMHHTYKKEQEDN